MAKKKPNKTRITLPLIDIEQMAADLSKRWQDLSSEELAKMDKEIDAAFPGGFTERDEANALIAMSVRNGPIENLHAGKHSVLLDDASLSRITDDEMRILMMNATAVLAGLIRLKTKNPELYNQMMKSYGRMYCQHWEREQ